MVKSTKAKFSRTILLLLLLIFFALFCCLNGCGNKGETTTPTTTPTINPASLDLLVSSQTLNSSGTPTVTLTAIVKDNSNRALADQVVSFSATSGSLTVNSATTDASGQATATLSTGGDKSNRIITVTATCVSISNTNTVSVVGTTLNVSGQDSVGYGSTATYTITLKDSAAVGIASQTVTITSQYNTLSTSTITTNANGQGTVTLTASDSGGHVDTLTATALGATGQKAVTVNSASVDFAFTTPLPNTEIPISTLTNVSIHYAISGVAQAGISVSFATSRGTLSSATATTNASGNATIQISATNVGRTTISATVAAGPSAQLDVEFVATTPASMTLQADPSGISTNIGTSTTQRSTLTATVRDAQNNLVKNQKINFTLITDPSGGYLSPATATTDSAGRATVLYIAGSADSGTNGVNIQAAIQGTAITQTTTLTVGGIAIFISIGTGPKITQVSDQTYQKNYDVLVTDAGGHAVSNATVTAILTPVAYLKGYWLDSGSAMLGYIWTPTLTSTHNTSLYSDSALAGYNYCLNEDMQYWNDPTHTAYLLNGSLDSGEDFNGNGKLDPGTVAAVSPSTVTTDSNGSGTFGVIYTKNYAMWVFVRLNVTVSAGGTEGKASTTFLLPYSMNDYAYPAPKQPDSPFGYSTTCADTL
jgi:Bacterial Ig-like domain (group 1)